MADSFNSIGLARECESPENRGAMEKRVALTPQDVEALIAAGADVAVAYGAGEGVCMAHFHSYPQRAALLQERQINVIAMEEILESPWVHTDTRILGRLAMNKALTPFIESNTIGGIRVRVLQWTPRLDGAIRRAGNRDPRSLDVLQGDSRHEELTAFGSEALYFYDSASFEDNNDVLAQLQASGCHLFDMQAYEQDEGQEAIARYREAHPPLEFGLRRTQCLHETGRAGARYGLQLLRENKPDLDLRHARVVVLGYGNVGQGAIHEVHSQGVGCVHILGRTHTVKGRIDYWLKGADLVINGAEQSPELRGINFLITNQHLKELMPDGSVVIDLVGGSETNRSPVEPVINCSFLTEPHFVQDGVSVSALWG